MKKLDVLEMEKIEGKGKGWQYYAGSCGVSATLLEVSWSLGPVVFGANAIYSSVCVLLVPLATASGKI
jgi:hypothetical protein